MPRVKKSKKEELEEDIEDIEELDDSEEPKKSSKKTSKPSGKTSSKSSKSSRSGKMSKKKGRKNETDDEEDEEDELSDLPVDDDDIPAETNEQDEIITSKNDKQPYKIIEPKTQIGKLKPVEILDYLIQYGTENTNQTLRSGAIILKKKITGKFKRSNFGSKRGAPPRGFQPRGNYSGNYGGNYGGSYGGNQNRGGNRNFKNQQRGPATTNEDLYGDDN